MNKKLYIIGILCIILVFYGIVTIDNAPENWRKTANIVAENEHYALSTDSGKFFLHYKGEEPLPDGITSAQMSLYLQYPSFSSVADMKEGIISGAISSLERDSLWDGARKDQAMEICDLNNLYSLQMPRNTLLKKVTWFGDSYSFTFESNDIRGEIKQLRGTLSGADAREEFQNSILSDKTIRWEKQIEDRNAIETEYFTFSSRMKHLKYDISLPDRTIHVLETYLLRSNFLSNEASSDIPWLVYFWGEQQGLSFYGTLTELESRPSVEWLSSFGLTPYVEDASAKGS